MLGGDGREVHVAHRLASGDHGAVCYGQAADVSNGVRVADAVRGTEWLVLPSPGLNGDVIYAPDAPEPIVVDGALLEQSAAREGGGIMGRSTPKLDEIASRMSIQI